MRRFVLTSLLALCASGTVLQGAGIIYPGPYQEVPTMLFFRSRFLLDEGTTVSIRHMT